MSVLIPQFEFVDGAVEYAQNIPVMVVAHLLGFPLEDADQFRVWIRSALEDVGEAREQREADQLALADYINKHIDQRIENPGDDLISYLLNADMEGEKLSREHVFGTVALALIAGIDTTWSAIGSSLWHLANNPDDLARLVADRSLIPTAVEELLRAYAPVTMARLVAKDHDFHGCPMKVDDWVLLPFPAANLDPEVFPDADKVLIDRAENRHSAFGLGIHRCLGSNLARLELTIAIEEFIDRFPSFTLGGTEDDVTWSVGQIRGPRELPVQVLAK